MANLNVTITFPDDKLIDFRDTIASELGYPTTVPNPQFNPAEPEDAVTNPRMIDNPQTKAQFIQASANEMLRVWIKNMYRARKHREATQSVQDLNVS